MEFNFDHTLFFALQRLDSPCMSLKPEQVASILVLQRSIIAVRSSEYCIISNNLIRTPPISKKKVIYIP